MKLEIGKLYKARSNLYPYLRGGWEVPSIGSIKINKGDILFLYEVGGIKKYGGFYLFYFLAPCGKTLELSASRKNGSDLKNLLERC